MKILSDENFVKVRLWFCQLMHLNQLTQKQAIKKIYNPNPDIEITMLAQVLNAPKKLPKSFITNEVYLVFVDSLCTSTTCTIFRDSISGFGYKESVLNAKQVRKLEEMLITTSNYDINVNQILKNRKSL